MAVVYRAQHPGLGKDVAVKVISTRFLSDATFIERFRVEAQAGALLRHPNIVRVHDYGEDQGVAYLAMELVDGGCLVDRLGRPLPWTYVEQIATQIGSALDYAHDHGVIHRDIKPSNILLTRTGEPMLADFGLAKILERPSQLTDAATLLGSAEYMAPEQALGKEVDPRADIYSFAVVLFEMMTGSPPFAHETVARTILAHAYEPLPSPRLRNPDLPEAVDHVFLKALAKDPGLRYPRARELVHALEAAHLRIPPAPEWWGWSSAVNERPEIPGPSDGRRDEATDDRLPASLAFAEEPVERTIRLFAGQRRLEADLSPTSLSGTVAVGNCLDLDEEELLRNLQAAQVDGKLLPDRYLQFIEEDVETGAGPGIVRFPNFSVEMEPGAGRTYVYVRTALELYRRYGLLKFIVLVPSLATRGRTLNRMKAAEAALRETYGDTRYRYYAYDPDRLSPVQRFAQSTRPELLVMTVDSFARESNRVYRSSEALRGQKPIELLRSTRPVLILDGPQNMETPRRVRALASLNPLFALRYGSHRGTPYNLIYQDIPKLTPGGSPERSTGEHLPPSSAGFPIAPRPRRRWRWPLAVTAPLLAASLVGGWYVAGQLPAPAKAPVTAVPAAASVAPANAVVADPIIVVVAPFDDSFASRKINVGQRISDALLLELRRQGVQNVELMPLPGGGSAAPKIKALEATRDLPATAVLLVWGWYDDGQVSSHVVLLRGVFDNSEEANSILEAAPPFVLGNGADEVLNQTMPTAMSQQVVRVVKLLR
jgi:hypothetical protein